MNAAHFLRLYHQSSQKIVNELEHYSDDVAVDFVETASAADTEDILKEHGLRLLWDTFYNSDFIRSLLILDFFKSSKVFEEESLYYFKSQLIEKACEIIISGNECDVIPAIFHNQECANFLLDQIEIILPSKRLGIALPALARFYSKLDNSNNGILPLYLFIEKDSNFCEFPQLRQLKAGTDDFRADLNKFKAQFKQIISAELLRNLETAKDVEIEVLRQLELDENVIETITDKVTEFKAKGTYAKMKLELSDLFDKLMKSIQTAIRSNEINIDEALRIRKDSVYTLLAVSPNPTDIESLLPPLWQILKNKSNIIFTIHQNELNALNSKKGNDPIASRLYLAILLIRELFESDQNVLSIVSELSKMFMDAWISDIQKTFTYLSELHSQIFSLSWLSAQFIGLNVDFKDAELVISSLGFHYQEIKTKYYSQAALLSGLFESEKVPSPALKSTEVSEARQQQRELLPHFISL